MRESCSAGTASSYKSLFAFSRLAEQFAPGAASRGFARGFRRSLRKLRLGSGFDRLRVMSAVRLGSFPQTFPQRAQLAVSKKRT